MQNSNGIRVVASAILMALIMFGIYYLLKPFVVDAFLPNQELINKTVAGYVYCRNEHDGKEAEFLLACMLLNLPVSVFVFNALQIFSARTLKVIALSAFTILFVAAKYYQIFGAQFAGTPLLFLLIAVVVLLLFLLAGFIKNNSVSWLIVFSCAFVCAVVPTNALSEYDYAFVSAPVVQLLQTHDLKNFHGQYDLLIGLPAAISHLFGRGVEVTACMVRISSLFFLLLFWIVSRKIFEKYFAFAITALLLVAKFSGEFDMAYIAGVSPLRLEAWIIPFAFALLLGASHFSVGIVLAVLLIIHFNFGFLFALAFLLFVIAKFLVEVFHSTERKMVELFLLNFQEYKTNIILMLSGFFLHAFLFGQIFSESILQYRSLQIGMLQVQQNSFFWLLPILFTGCFLLLFNQWNDLEKKFREAVLFLLLLFVFVCNYFLGRSAEANLIHICGSFILLFGISIHLLSVQKLEKHKKYFQLIPIAIVALFLIVRFRVSVSEKFFLVAERITHFNLHEYPTTFPETNSKRVFERLNPENKKVYFLTFGGSSYYYSQENNAPVQAAYVPADAWLLQAEHLDFVNALLQKNYLVVCNINDEFHDTLLKGIHYSRADTLENFMAIRR